MKSKPFLPGVPLLLPVVMMAVAVVVSVHAGQAALWIGVAALSAGVLAGVMRKFAFSVTCVFFCVGAVATAIVMPNPAETAFSGIEAGYRGYVAQATYSATSQRLIVDGISGLGGGKCVVSYSDCQPVVEPGDSVVFSGVLEPVAMSTLVPGERNFSAYYLRNGIVARCRVEAGTLAVTEEGTDMRNRMARWRDFVADVIHDRMGLRPDAARMLRAVLTGDAGGIDSGDREQFATAGVAHVLALSGMHVAVLAFVVSLMLFPLRLMGRRRWAMGAVIVLVWCFALFSGMSPSVVRAAVMASVVMTGKLLRQGSVPLNNLCFAAMLILVIDPLALFAPGFQLSFMAVASILLFSPLLMPDGRMPFAVRAVLDWIVVSVSAVIGTGVLAAWHFHEIPLYFIIANIPVAILLPWFMGFGLAGVVCAASGVDAAWLAEAVDALYVAIRWCVDSVASLPGASVRGVYFHWWLMLPCYAAVGCLWGAMRFRRRALLWSAGLLTLFTCGMFAVDGHGAYPRVEAWVINDEFATSLLLRDGRQAWVLTDAKPKFHDSVRDRMNARFAEYCNVRGIDSLVVTSHIRGNAQFYADSSVWVVGHTEFVIGEKQCNAPIGRHAECRVRYLLLTSGFHGDAATAASAVQADTVIVSPTLYPTQAARFVEQLQGAGIPWRKRPGMGSIPL